MTRSYRRRRGDYERATRGEAPELPGKLKLDRELDEDRSTPQQPVLKHEQVLKLKGDEIVPVEIEIWPSGTRFDEGESLRIVVQGSDIYEYDEPLVANRHRELVNKGTHVIHTGGPYDSHLLIPVVPEK